MIIYNYTALKNNDTKIYNIGGKQLSGGISITFLKITAPVALVIIGIGYLISLALNFDFINPLAPNFHKYYTGGFLIVGIGTGLAMWYVQFAGYRLYQYLLAYIRPKKVYTNRFRLEEYKLTNIKIKSIIKNLL